MKYLVFGSLNVDYTYRVDQLVHKGETIKAHSEEISYGGKGFNQAIALSRASNSNNVYFAGCIGKDDTGHLDLLMKERINTDLIKRSKLSTGKAVIQVDNDGNNAIVIYSGANYDITSSDIYRILSVFDEGDIIILQNEISGVNEIIDKAKAIGMTIIYNPSPYNEEVAKVDLSLVDYLFINEIEGAMMSGYSSAEEILEDIHRRYPLMKTVLTLGEKGSLYMDENGKVLIQSIYQTEAVDTTAAGDTYTGYFIANLANIPYAMKAAAIASGIAVSIKGSSKSIPKQETVERVLDESSR